MAACPRDRGRARLASDTRTNPRRGRGVARLPRHSPEARARVTAGGVRVPRARTALIVATVAACSALLWTSRTYSFYFDEWTFITNAPGWTLASYFQPHNEHPSILSQLVYAVLLHTVGLRTYVPYMVFLLLAHAANVLLLFELVRRRSGDLVALGAALLLLFLGAAWEDLIWAFQMAWLASVA